MSMFICHECGAYSDSDDGCGESEDGKHCVCLDCCCEECGEKPKIGIYGDMNLCAACLQDWKRGKRAYKVGISVK